MARKRKSKTITGQTLPSKSEGIAAPSPSEKFNAVAEPTTPETSNAERWLFWGGLAGIVAFAGTVRFACLFNDLWLDEIFTLQLLDGIHSPAGIFTHIHSDNNHPLNSLFLYFLKPAQAEWTYRLLSWATGTASVWIAGVIARKQYALLHPADKSRGSLIAGWVTAAIFGGSYIMVHYSSEARGYAPAVCFGLVAFYCLQRAQERVASPWAMVYCLACVLGLLSQVLVFYVMAAGLAWSMWRAIRTWPNWRCAANLACWHLVPWLFFGFYYVFFIRRFEYAGANPTPFHETLGAMAAFSFGFPLNTGLYLAVPVVVLVVLAGLYLVWRQNRSLAAFYLLVIFIAPIPVILLRNEKVELLPRYFLINITFMLLLAGYALARLRAHGRIFVGVQVALLALFLLGNSLHVARLLRDGRGQYQDAIQYVSQHTPGKSVVITGDFDIRNVPIIQHYAGLVAPGRPIYYFPQNRLPPVGAQWAFVCYMTHNAHPNDVIRDAANHEYKLVRVFPYSALSGWDWYLFRSVDPRVLLPSSG